MTAEHERDERDEREEPSLADLVQEASNEALRAAPGLLRVAATSWWHGVQWAVGTSLATGSRIVRAVAAGEPPTQIVSETAAELRSAASDLLGLSGLSSERGASAAANGADSPSRRSTVEELRARGAELLRRSADVRSTEDTHPAYGRILGDLTPDEARILRFLATEGPQPTVDVRTNRPLGIGSELVAAGLSMIGMQAGVRKLEQTNAYLNNLFRLGLVWFSREEVEPSRYQVVEVQPEVQEAMARAGRAPRTIRRSIHLTPFGEDFCRAVLLPADDDAAYPVHGAPEEDEESS